MYKKRLRIKNITYFRNKYVKKGLKFKFFRLSLSILTPVFYLIRLGLSDS